MVGEQLIIGLNGNETPVGKLTLKDINKKLVGTNLKGKIGILEEEVKQTTDLQTKRTINISLGMACVEMASSFKYESTRDKNRADYLIKAIRAYENAGFNIGAPDERKRLCGLYSYASRVCIGIGMLKESVEFSENAHKLGKSCGIINLPRS